ncbi:hypothetical protein ES703_116731 [subsurface metagenome]
MKILTFLKGGPMKIQFNKAQLSRAQKKSLLEVLNVLQAENEGVEIVVTVVEFPLKLLVELDSGHEMLLGWDVEKQIYAGLTTPESTESKPEIPEPEPSPRTIPAAELVKSEIGQRVDALASAFVRLAMPFDADQRLEIWIAFCTIVFKEFLK